MSDEESPESEKMSGFAAYMALCKGYCAINILVLPKQFDNGGWLIGSASIVFAAFFVLLTGLKLVECGDKVKMYTYPDIAFIALGAKGKKFIQIILAFVQFSFTIAQISFSLNTFQIIVRQFSPDLENLNLWWFAMIIMIAYPPIAWVRKLQKFAIGYILGCVMIIYTVFVVFGYSFAGLANNGQRDPEGFVAVNPEQSSVWGMIGFSFFCFEGIGTVMPVREQTKSSVNFKRTLTAAMMTLMVLFGSFGFICYYYFGHQDESFVIANFDQNDRMIEVTRLLFCINLVFSYPLTIYPTNIILEQFIFIKFMTNTTTRKWLKNLSRSIICFLGVFLAIELESVLDKFLGVSGALLGIPIILIIPTLCHYNLVASSKNEKMIDIGIIVFSAVIMCISTYLGIKSWIDSK